jgi:hypothetical protein
MQFENSCGPKKDKGIYLLIQYLCTKYMSSIFNYDLLNELSELVF